MKELRKAQVDPTHISKGPVVALKSQRSKKGRKEDSGYLTLSRNR